MKIVKKAVKPAVQAENKIEKILEGFTGLWTSLFTSPVHLDSALSKLPPRLKGILAQILPAMLLRPASLGEALGVGIPEGEPWRLDEKQLANWRPGQLIAERLYSGMSQKWPDLRPVEEDFPFWMVEEWKKSWDAQTVAELVDTLGREAPLSLRATRKVGAQGLLKALTAERLPTRVGVSDFAPWGVRLASYAPVLNTEVYKTGGFEIQDEGSQWMALFALWPELFGSLLTEKPQAIKNPSKLQIGSDLFSDRPNVSQQTELKVPAVIIDACAGAGGKSLAMADAVRGKGRVYAYDTSDKKLQGLRRRATRLGLNNIQSVQVHEGRESELVDQFEGKADVVLVDAPCSGWGVLRRNPDIKWRQKRDVLTRMPEIQIRLLSLYSKLVAPGGRLIFGVCTFRPAETRDIVRQFLEQHPQFKPLEGGFLGPGPCDGFFMQAFIKE